MGKINVVGPVKHGSKVRLSKVDAADTSGLPAKDATMAMADADSVRIGELQDVLWADGKHALLVIFQGMDAAGKDGVIRKVFDHVNPRGIVATSFRVPSEEERSHDFLWRVHKVVPALGTIGLFNRSHYEETTVVRVHAKELLPAHVRAEKHLWEKRFAMINDFEQLLTACGTTVVKFFLHISKQEQKERLEERQQDPVKHWKLSASDFAERKLWEDYQTAYEEVISATSTENSPWYVVPADHKWVRDFHVGRVVRAALEGMKLRPREPADKSLLHKRFK